MLMMNVTLAELPGFAKDFIERLPKTASGKARVIGLSGELGAGKTTFVQETAKVLGVSIPVTSPTFVLAQPYAISRAPFSRLVHIDAYRLASEEKDTFGWGAYIADPANLVIVEWPERVPGSLPEGTQILKFAVIGEGVRDITETYA